MTDAATPMSMVLPKEYPLIALSCVILCIECFSLGILVVAPARLKFFSKEYMEQFK